MEQTQTGKTDNKTICLSLEAQISKKQEVLGRHLNCHEFSVTKL